MNERIKLLVEEARLITVDDTTRYASDNEFEQRFAELIVQKCMSFQDEAGVYSKFDMADAIAQHFGVEK